MVLTRRDFGRVALATAAVPAGTLFGAKPNSKIDGVQIGVSHGNFQVRFPALGPHF